MISSNVEKAINSQINAELWSAYLYLSMSLDADSKSFEGLGHWFFAQSIEEQHHARLLQEYLLSRGGKVRLQPIIAVPHSWPSVQEMFQDTLAHEQEVTAMIDNLVTLAQQERDYATLSRLQWFVDEQIEEEQSVSTILSTLALPAPTACSLITVDRELASRSLPATI